MAQVLLTLSFYTPEKAYSMIELYGDEGCALYRTFAMTGDVIYPVVYSILFSLVITWLFQRSFASSSKLQILNVVPFGAWLFDWLENINIVTMLSLYPSTPSIVARLASICTDNQVEFWRCGHTAGTDRICDGFEKRV